MTSPVPHAVVIGASAGGVVALQRLLGALPACWPIPVLVVLHLPRDRPSGMARLLATHCAVPVSEAEDKGRIGGGEIVLAPPDYHLLVEDRGTLALSVDAPVLFSRPSIDVLFESAAHAFGPDLLAIVLTGANADGADGARVVRQAGGTVWIQDPADAEVPAMPTAALDRAGGDAVLTLSEMCDRLTSLRP